MKVVHITSAHPHTDIRIFRKECVSLATNGFQVLLVAPGADNRVVSGVSIIGIKKLNGRLARIFISTVRVFLRARKEKADIYHFHDPELLPIGLILQWSGAKVIYDAHEDVPRQIVSKHWIPRPLRRVVSAIVERIENWIGGRLSGIVAATPHITERMTLINSNTVNINNYPLPAELAPPANAVIRKKQVCYVGGISRIRGLKPLVKSLQYTSGTRLVLCGRFAEPDFKAELETLPGWANVDYRGQVDREELRIIMSESLAGIVTFLPLPNHIDAQPNKMFEYMSAELPVIASDFPLWREIIDGAGAGLCVDPESTEAIAAAIRQLADDSGLVEKLGKSGRAAILSKYNWPVEAQKLIKFYKEIL